MLDWLSQQSAGQMIGLVAVIGGPLIAIVAIVSAAWARVRRAELQARQAETEAVLKQQMIERGMSADEIVRVLAAGQGKNSKQHANAEERVA
jgi:hypothetical protein